MLTTPVGLRLPPDLTFEQWVETGPKLLRAVDTFAWCLGDWLIFGQEKYRNRYAEAIKKVGLDYQTLRNCAWVARKFDPARRRETLSFQHHVEVASLPPDEQDAWLDRAEQHRWSKTTLRKQIKDQRAAGQPTGAMTHPLPVRVADDRLASWRAAAERAGVDFVDWVVATLDNEVARMRLK